MLRDLSSSATLTVSTGSASARELVSARSVTSPGLVQGLDLFFASRVPRSKRVMDIVGSVVVLVLFSPDLLAHRHSD